MNAVSRSLLSLALLACACAKSPPPPAAEPTPARAAPAAVDASVASADATAAVPAPAVASPAKAANAPATASAPVTAAAATSAATVLVHKTPTCGCCNGWVDHLRARGFHVEVQDHDDLVAVKQRLGVPMSKASCHTAEVGGYFVEGHVPAADIRRLLAEKPDARGITAPGMPVGSPGMEAPDGSVQPYTVELVRKDGTAVAFATHGQ
jgi:hypothetical protein